MSKSKDGKYLCVSCTGLLGRYYPGCFIQDHGEVRKHLEYMEKMRDIYDNVFLQDDEKITIKNESLGIIISEKHGLFKVVDDEWAEFNAGSDKELFRLDQINRYEMFNEHRENVYINNGAFVQSGVKIYMNSALRSKYNKYRPAQNQKIHPYVYELEILTASEERLSPAAISEAGGVDAACRIMDALDRIFGSSKADAAEARRIMGIRADEAGFIV